MRIGRLGRGDDLLVARARAPHRDVVAHRSLEQEILLADIADLAAQRRALDRSGALPVDQDFALMDVVEAQDQAHDRRLAAARAADQRGRLAGLGDEADVAQHRLLRAIAEADVAKLEPAGRDREFGLVGQLALLVGLVEKIVQHPDAEQRRREVDVQARQPLHRLVDHDHRGDEREQGARRLAAVDHRAAAVEHDGGDGEAGEALHHRARARADPRELVGGAWKLSIAARLTFAHEAFEGERFDDADALRGLLQRFHDRHRALEFVGHDLAHADADLAHGEGGDGHEDQRDRREQRVAHDHDDDQADEGQQVAPDRRDEQVERGARRLGDERLAGDEFGRMALGVRGDLHPQHLVEDALLDVGDDGVGDPRQRRPDCCRSPGP